VSIPGGGGDHFKKKRGKNKENHWKEDMSMFGLEGKGTWWVVSR